MLRSFDDKMLATCSLYRQSGTIEKVQNALDTLRLKNDSDSVIKVKGTNSLALKRLALSDSYLLGNLGLYPLLLPHDG